ncbi:MAG: AbrB/MazE/SpoVT family DNA-binding domain-containing protein, partial [Sphingomonadaceae bacterium]
MAQPDTLITTVSTKGQVILPKAIRTHRKWDAGTRLVVEETPDGVLLKRAPAFAPTR